MAKDTEWFGSIDHVSSKESCKCRHDIIYYDYYRSKAAFEDSTPNRFFLLSPNEWHIVKVATDKESQDIRVIVVKLDYVKISK